MAVGGSTDGRKKREENLLRVPKGGKSPNPSGLSREARQLIAEIKEAARAALADVAPGRGGRTNLDAMLRKLVTLGLDGDVGAIRELLDRAYGKPTQSLDADVNLKRPIIVRLGIPDECDG